MNLHISYDLQKPNKNYDAAIAKIKTLGNWAKIHHSYSYVSSRYTVADACAAVWEVMDSNDSLYVVDATNNAAAYILSQWKI